MKSIKIEKLEKVATTDKRDLKIGIVAFQLVKFEINYFGSIVTSILDTKILSNGKQIVIDGCGFIPAGTEI